jgi:DNA-binding CsgD family transcriptional regulator
MDGPPDVVSLLEALYLLELPRERWLNRVIEASGPFLEPHGALGIGATLFTCPDPFSFKVENLAVGEGVTERVREAYYAAQFQLGPKFVAESHWNRMWTWSLKLVPGWDEVGPVATGQLGSTGIRDVCCLNAFEPDGTGASLVAGLRSSISPSKRDTVTLALLARHFISAHRLLRRFDGSVDVTRAEAVLEPGGRVHHATGVARLGHSRTQLRRAVEAIEGARAGRRSRASLESALAWPSQVDGRWTLLDHFDTDGRRFLVAIDNRSQPAKALPLSERESDVVHRALRGCSNKEIAYDLGLAHSTVKVLMARAAAKVGARSRRDLLLKLANAQDIAPSGTGIESVPTPPSATRGR